MTEPVLTDIVGQEVRPGDPVVYPQMSGRSVQMVLGTLVSYNGKTAQIARASGSRWAPSYATKHYRDKRTGKGIDPWATDKHYAEPPRTEYTHHETGKKITEAEYRELKWYLRTQYDYGKHVAGVLHDYVEEYEDQGKPVTIRNTANIIKVIST